MASSSHEKQVGSGRCRSVRREKSRTERKGRKGKERKKERKEKKEMKERGEDRLLPPSFFGIRQTKEQGFLMLQEVGVSLTLVPFHLRAIKGYIVQSQP